MQGEEYRTDPLIDVVNLRPLDVDEMAFKGEQGIVYPGLPRPVE
jgi:hypothetical protein